MPTFVPTELLFRQVPNTHIEEGEVSFFAIRKETKFSDDPAQCTSVVRSVFTATFLDAIHPNCAGNKVLSATHSIRHVQVANLPKGMKIHPEQQGDGRRWDMFPHHEPLPLCYAHSTICCCNQDAPGVSVCPPPSVRDDFRHWFAENLVPSDALVDASLFVAADSIPGTTRSASKIRVCYERLSRLCKFFLAKLTR